MVGRAGPCHQPAQFIGKVLAAFADSADILSVHGVAQRAIIFFGQIHIIH